MKNVYWDNRWVGEHGIGRFAGEVQQRLGLVDTSLPLKPSHPLDPLLLTAWMAQRRGLFFSPGYNCPLLFLSRYVMVVHDLNHIDVAHNSSILKRIYYRLVLRSGIRRAAKVLTVSHFTARRISEWCDIPVGDIAVVGNGVSTAFSPDGERLALQSPYFLVVGNRKGHKNEVRAVEAFAAMPDRADLLLAFTGVSSPELVDKARALGIEDRLHFLGRLDEDGLASAYRGSLGLVFPSLYEGFGLPVIEAMACGVPVITSTTTSLPEIAGDAALLVDPESVPDIRLAMERIHRDPTLVAALRSKGLIRASAFTWDDVAAKVAAAIQQATASQKSTERSL